MTRDTHRGRPVTEYKEGVVWNVLNYLESGVANAIQPFIRRNTAKLDDKIAANTICRDRIGPSLENRLKALAGQAQRAVHSLRDKPGPRNIERAPFDENHG